MMLWAVSHAQVLPLWQPLPQAVSPSFPQVCSYPYQADNGHPMDHRQPSLPSVSCCRISRSSSLSPLSSLSPVPPQWSLGCLAPSGAQTFLFQPHQHHRHGISFNTAMWHLFACKPIKPLLQAPDWYSRALGKSTTVILQQGLLEPLHTALPS